MMQAIKRDAINFAKNVLLSAQHDTTRFFKHAAYNSAYTKAEQKEWRRLKDRIKALETQERRRREAFDKKVNELTQALVQERIRVTTLMLEGKLEATKAVVDFNGFTKAVKKQHDRLCKVYKGDPRDERWE